MIPKVIFRFEASTTIGAGHAIRSMVLATRFKELNWKVQIATKIETYHFISILKEFERIEPESLLDGSQTCDILVIDSYDIDINLEFQFREYANKIIVIDDLANRQHDCDILIDQGYSREENCYKALVPAQCKILVGSDYVMIRSDFYSIKEIAITKRLNTKVIKHILITMGGSDPGNFTELALRDLLETGFDGEIDIITGFKKNPIASLDNLIKSVKNKIEIYTNPKMETLMLKADLAIGASGSSVWERCFLGLPSILYVTAENQKDFYQSLISNEICYSKDRLNEVLKKPYQLLSKVEKYCDGHGATRIIENIFS